MDSLGHSTLPILRVEIYASLASIRIKYATASLDTDHLILAVAISAEDKKLQKRSVGLVVSKKKSAMILYKSLHGILTLKGILERFSEQYG